MNLLTIAYKSIRQRALASSLTALSVALGVMLMVTVLVIYGLVDDMFRRSGTGYDLVVGPKGAKLQLVLNTIYRVSQPIENLPYRFYRELKEDPRVGIAIPVALGDRTELNAFPIVGTIPQYFTVEYMPGKKFGIKGDLMRDPFHAIIGSTVARQNGWDEGSKFKMVHAGTDDHVHDEEFTVVGVLGRTGTPDDKTVFVHIDGFYLIDGHDKPLGEAVRREAEFFGEEVDEQALQKMIDEEDSHDHHSDDGHHHHGIHEAQKEVTAILVRTKKPIMTPMFQAEMNEGIQAQAVNPIREISWLMENIVGNVRRIFVVLTALIIVVSGVGIFVSIYNSMADRRREIAIMRALGARRATVFSIILSESVLLCFTGGLLGVLMGHGLVFIAAPIVEARSGLLIDPYGFEPLELVLIPALIILASLVGFVPGMTAYRTDVAKTLGD